MRVNSRKAGAGTVFWKHQLHETCGEQLTTAIVVVGAPDMLSGGTGEWILACERRKKERVAYLPTHSPIPHSLTSVQPTCSPHDIPLLILSCIFHSHVHAILTAIFSLSTPCHAPICFPKKTTTPVLCSITAHACATT